VKNNRADSGAFIGVGGLVVALFLYGYTAIALPSWLHTLLMPLIWLALFVLGCVWFTPHPRRAAFLPIVAIGAWFALMIGLGPTA
jgi:cbb3-type cytochrome oxidase subunit 3